MSCGCNLGYVMAPLSLGGFQMLRFYEQVNHIKNLHTYIHKLGETDFPT